MARTLARIRKSPKSRPDLSPTDFGERYACIHGHFYQPPRENPWLETVEVQSSAAPYHDWNERITAECYAPNGASRILNDKKNIVRITNNYAWMSFNFGPTLLSWLEEFSPRTYRLILDADKASSIRYSGHGSAMAQVYNHIIMPLASTRDALTQIRWGIADFVHRFGRKPEGMWLAETAANTHVLDLLAQEGIKFTILAPLQAARVRPLAQQGEEDPEWVEVPDGSVDSTRPYTIKLPEGRSIAVFFYDGPDSRAVAFEGLLESGEKFAQRLASSFHTPTEDEEGTETPAPGPQLVHIATDGESYGHHHKHGDMALAFAMHYLEDKGIARLTNYGEYLEKFPPKFEAQVVENSAWSCAHGVERWKSNCGCNSGRGDWNQEWRAPLREALDALRDAVAPLTEQFGASFFDDVWAARDGYIQVILDRSLENETRFLAEFARRPLSHAERVRVWELMELQRHTQLMYTSCGWFFDDISGIETVQVVAYAGRVLELARKLFGEEAVKPIEDNFLAVLADAKSNMEDPANGAEVYHQWVKPMFIGLEQVGAHYAISSTFRPYPEEGGIFCFDVRRITEEVFSSGHGRLAIGRAQVRSRITEEQEEVCFAVLHLGDQNLSAAVSRYGEETVAGFEEFSRNVREAMERADLPEVIRQIDHQFGRTAYSLSSLFHDEQQRILRTILDKTVTEVETSLRGIYEQHSSLLHFLSRGGMPTPPALSLAAEFALNANLRQAFESDLFDALLVRSLLKRAEEDHIALNETQLRYSAAECMRRALRRLEQPPALHHSVERLSHALDLAEVIGTMPFEVDLWQAQNIWNDIQRRGAAYWPQEWLDTWMRLGEALHIETSQLVTEPGVPALPPQIL
jgi:alpha-amylase/alpha-mannosidase (GH57 family)